MNISEQYINSHLDYSFSHFKKYRKSKGCVKNIMPDDTMNYKHICCFNMGGPPMVIRGNFLIISQELAARVPLNTLLTDILKCSALLVKAMDCSATKRSYF